MSVTNLNETTFEELLAKKEGIVVIDFWAPWCGPCRVFAPVFDAASKKNPDITFAKVNTQDEPAIAGALQITAIPTLMVLRDGVLVFRQAGAMNAKMFTKLLDSVKELDMDEVRKKVAEAQASA